ncbi:Swi5-domain-containing protein [Aspergillus caelatus]|uniref:Swi5-domain-containing protein n=2 Tax=Aspergillus subgen. Circumdati TaxID=2720871 RepID=A0A5N6ZY03_9EURO|nr:Swi5-domain-containing protein [Aspergillus caelatus]KAE8362163.1 Swi5-domain-containing protein [Aspergillus caelatus]KAE8412598.1 Swi5-domain-containing protein [Aspergillus pseudocaelatus]
MTPGDKIVAIENGNKSHRTPEQQTYREKRFASLHTSVTGLEAEVARMEAQLAETKARLKSDASTTVQRHITLLHEYNEIKDIGQGLTGLIADARGVRQIEVQREYGVGDRD